jgi:tRNA-dihydrouridine synthase 1
MAAEPHREMQGAVEARGTRFGGDGTRKRTKLHGRAFYESIGSPSIVLAPMVEQSEFVRASPSFGSLSHILPSYLY